MRKEMTNNKINLILIFTFILINVIFFTSFNSKYSNSVIIKEYQAVTRVIGDLATTPTTTPAETIVSDSKVYNPNDSSYGVPCSSFTVHSGINKSIGVGTQNSKGVWMGPYIKGQGNLMYPVTENCGTGIEYATFCLDPARQGVYASTGGARSYVARALDTDTNFGKWMYGLYRAYVASGDNLDDPYTYFKYVTAARLLEYDNDAGFPTVGGSRSTNEVGWLKSVQNGGGLSAGELGSVGVDAKALADAAKNTYATEENIEKATNASMGIRISSVNSYDPHGNSYTVTMNVIVDHVQNDSDVNKSMITLSDSAADTAFRKSSTIEKFDESSHTKTYTFDFDMMFEETDCAGKEITVTLKYKVPSDVGDLRKVFILSANGGSTTLQRFIAFAKIPGSGDATGEDTIVSNKAIVGATGGEGCECDPATDPDCPGGGGGGEPHNPDCENYQALACTDDDATYPIINEGVKFGESDTNWEDCIIGHSDENGNSYDIINTKELDSSLGNVDEGLSRSNIDGYLSNKDQITQSDYCQISCKEEYRFVLPGNKKDVKQGTYFAFHVDGADINDPYHRHAVVGVGAERRCVTTMDGSHASTADYEKRVKDFRRQEVDFLNMYMYYQQLYNLLNTKAYAQDYMKQATHNYTSYGEVTSWPKDKINEDHCAANKWKTNTPKKSDIYSENELLNSPAEGSTKCGVSDCSIKNSLSIYGVDASQFTNKTVNFKLYTMPSANDLTGNGGLVEVPVSIDISKSFKENVNSKTELNRHWTSGGALVPSTPWDLYETIYKSGYPENYFVVKPDVVEQQAPVSKTYSVDHYYTEDAEKVDEHNDPDDSTKVTGSHWECNNTEWHDSHDDTTVAYNPYWKDEFKDANDLNDDHAWSQYKTMLQKLIDAANFAKEKLEALNSQIQLQSDSIEVCNNYLDKVNTYKFNPEITFKYADQDEYMKELAPNLLINMNTTANGGSYEEPQSNYELHYCSSYPGNAAEVFNCNDDKNEQKFEFINALDKNAIAGGYNSGASSLGAATSDGNLKNNFASNAGSTDTVTYNSVARAGSISTYGRFSSTNEFKDKCSGRDCFEFYRSAKAFFVRKADGIVTTTKTDDSSILSTDGFVYPVAITTTEGQHPYYVTFSNIGQYFESGSLGRIMGGGDGHPGNLVGVEQDEEVCYYEVCRFDDPGCGNPNYCYKNGEKIDITSCLAGGKTWAQCDEEYCSDGGDDDGGCASIVTTYCNNGNVNGITKKSDYRNCITKLLAYADPSGDSKKNCCDYVDSYIAMRGGGIPDKAGETTNYDKYTKICPKANYCDHFTVVTSSSSSSITTDLTDITDVNNNGALQINARATSLSNLFPNNTDRSSSVGVGVNWWISPEARDIRDEIESKGDSIYNGTPQYSITMTSSCINDVRDYNNDRDSTGEGFNDTEYNVNAVSDAYSEDDSKGRNVTTPEFRNYLRGSSCSNDLIYPDEPQSTSTSIDSSRVEK